MTFADFQDSIKRTYRKGNAACHALGLAGELAESVTEVMEAIGPLNTNSLATYERERVIEAFKRAGAICDAVKKQEFHSNPLTPTGVDKLRKELGDLLWYIAATASDFDLTLDDIAQGNIDKLAERYPDGFVKGGGKRTREEKIALVEGLIKSGQKALADSFDKAEEELFANVGGINRAIEPPVFRNVAEPATSLAEIAVNTRALLSKAPEAVRKITDKPAESAQNCGCDPGANWGCANENCAYRKSQRREIDCATGPSPDPLCLAGKPGYEVCIRPATQLHRIHRNRFGEVWTD